MRSRRSNVRINNVCSNNSVRYRRRSTQARRVRNKSCVLVCSRYASVKSCSRSTRQSARSSPRVRTNSRRRPKPTHRNAKSISDSTDQRLPTLRRSWTSKNSNLTTSRTSGAKQSPSATRAAKFARPPQCSNRWAPNTTRTRCRRCTSQIRARSARRSKPTACCSRNASSATTKYAASSHSRRAITTLRCWSCRSCSASSLPSANASSRSRRSSARSSRVRRCAVCTTSRSRGLPPNSAQRCLVRPSHCSHCSVARLVRAACVSSPRRNPQHPLRPLQLRMPLPVRRSRLRWTDMPRLNARRTHCLTSLPARWGAISSSSISWSADTSRTSSSAGNYYRSCVKQNCQWVARCVNCRVHYRHSRLPTSAAPLVKRICCILPRQCSQNWICVLIMHLTPSWHTWGWVVVRPTLNTCYRCTGSLHRLSVWWRTAGHAAPVQLQGSPRVRRIAALLIPGVHKVATRRQPNISRQWSKSLSKSILLSPAWSSSWRANCANPSLQSRRVSSRAAWSNNSVARNRTRRNVFGWDVYGTPYARWAQNRSSRSRAVQRSPTHTLLRSAASQSARRRPSRTPLRRLSCSRSRSPMSNRWNRANGQTKSSGSLAPSNVCARFCSKINTMVRDTGAS